MNIQDIKKVGVVGAGQMGGGIAELLIAAGYPVIMRDVNEAATDKGKKRISSDFDRRVQKGRMTADEQKAAMGRLSATTRLEDFKDCDLVIEAASENIDIKKRSSRPLTR